MFYFGDLQVEERSIQCWGEGIDKVLSTAEPGLHQGPSPVVVGVVLRARGVQYIGTVSYPPEWEKLTWDRMEGRGVQQPTPLFGDADKSTVPPLISTVFSLIGHWPTHISAQPISLCRTIRCPIPVAT